MKLYDLSMTITPTMTVYKNKPQKKPSFKNTATFSEQGVYETDLTMNLHTGTHIDFPLHTLPGGQMSNHHDLKTFLGMAKVFDLTHVEDHITASDLMGLAIEEDDFVLFKTRNSWIDSFDFDFVYVDLSAAIFLSNKNIRGVGIDALGIERAQPLHPTHDQLLSHGIIILEGLRLKDVPPKTYEFISLPLKIADVEALPVRTILIDREE